MSENYNPEESIEKICLDNKIFFIDPLEFLKVKTAGFLPLVHNELNKFLESKPKNGFHILYLIEPITQFEYIIKIKYENAIEDELVWKEEEIDIFDLDKRGNLKVNIEKTSNYLIKKFIFKTLIGIKDFQTYVYESGIYQKIGLGFIKVETEKIIGESCNNYLVSEILAKVQRKTCIDPKDFEKTPENIIPFLNGGYNFETGLLEEYKPDWNFKQKLNVSFISGKDCPRFKKFLEETLYPEDVRLIQELFGFVFLRKYLLKKAFIFVGGKNTGKTTLINILISLIGIQNCSGLSLQRIGTGKPFDLASLYNKYLNFYDDLSSKDLIDNSGFKIATGGGFITAEQKFGDIFQFLNFAKLLFATNKIPPVKELDDEAYFFRNIPVRFDNEVCETEINPNLVSELTSPEELTGILNWALEGLMRLLENKKFSFTKTAEEIKSIMCRSGNPLYSFVSDVLRPDTFGRLNKEQMFEIYKVYSNENKLTPLSKEQLGRQLQKIAPWIADKRDTERYWENVSISSRYLGNIKIKSILDTLDTSQNNIRKEENNNIIPIDIIFQKASNPSKEIPLEMEGVPNDY